MIVAVQLPTRRGLRSIPPIVPIVPIVPMTPHQRMLACAVAVQRRHG